MLEKKIVLDKIEVVEDGIVQLRQATFILENGQELSKTYHRWSIAPGQSYDDQEDKVKAICAVVHTPEVIQAFKEKFASLKLAG